MYRYRLSAPMYMTVSTRVFIQELPHQDDRYITRGVSVC